MHRIFFASHWITSESYGRVEEPWIWLGGLIRHATKFENENSSENKFAFRIYVPNWLEEQGIPFHFEWRTHTEISSSGFYENHVEERQVTNYSVILYRAEDAVKVKMFFDTVSCEPYA